MNSAPNFLTPLGGTLFFSASTDEKGDELWKSDGTREGTVLVKDITPGPEGSHLDGLTAMDGALYFIAGPFFFDPDPSGIELWRSDGTEAGTIMVRDINPGPLSSFPFGVTGVDGTLFFSADDGAHGSELWKSDGTGAGTVLVRDINPAPSSSNPGHLTAVGETLFFSAFTQGQGVELWKSDGTWPR